MLNFYKKTYNTIYNGVLELGGGLTGVRTIEAATPTRFLQTLAVRKTQLGRALIQSARLARGCRPKQKHKRKIAGNDAISR